MRRVSPIRQRLTAIGIAGAIALSYPMLGLSSGDVGGFPGGFLYMFGVWGLLIALAALVAEGRRE